MSGILATTANQAYKKYKEQGGTLAFKDFLTREQHKIYAANGEDSSVFLVKPALNDTVQTAINDMLKQGGLKDEESGKTVFGINKNIVIGAGLLVAGIVIFIIVKKVKK